jgi:hypothetical protein
MAVMVSDMTRLFLLCLTLLLVLEAHPILYLVLRVADLPTAWMGTPRQIRRLRYNCAVASLACVAAQVWLIRWGFTGTTILVLFGY